jgi:dihydroorotate dehydrogenase
MNHIQQAKAMVDDIAYAVTHSVNLQEALKVSFHVLLSAPQDLRLPLRWIAILSGTLPIDFASTGGIHQAKDSIKVFHHSFNHAQENWYSHERR